MADTARIELEAALVECGVEDYEEVDILGPEAPDELRGWGSPTILVDGADIAGQPKGDSLSCRVYEGAKGVPDRAAIMAGLRARSAGGSSD